MRPMKRCAEQRDCRARSLRGHDDAAGNAASQDIPAVFAELILGRRYRCQVAAQVLPESRRSSLYDIDTAHSPGGMRIPIAGLVVRSLLLRGAAGCHCHIIGSGSPALSLYGLRAA